MHVCTSKSAGQTRRTVFRRSVIKTFAYIKGGTALLDFTFENFVYFLKK